MIKEKCKNCQKKELEVGNQEKEQEYLHNYAFVYSYSTENCQKNGAGYVKTDTDVKDCCAGRKDQDGKVLKQRNCLHCCPWEFTDNSDSKEKCVNYGKEIRDAKCFEMMKSPFALWNLVPEFTQKPQK